MTLVLEYAMIAPNPVCLFYFIFHSFLFNVYHRPFLIPSNPSNSPTSTTLAYRPFLPFILFVIPADKQCPRTQAGSNDG